MAALLCTLLSLAASAVDAYTIGKEVSEMMRFQHQSGGFYDSDREANARDTLHAVWIAATYGAFSHIDTRQCFKWIPTLHNRDGGSGMYPGAKSSIYATYCTFHMNVLVSPEQIDATRILEFLRGLYDSASGLFKNSADAEPSIEATYYAYELVSKFRDADLSWMSNQFAIRNKISDLLLDDHFEIEGVSPIKAQLWAGSIAKFISLTVPYHRVSEFVVAKLQQAIKDGKLESEDAYAATRILYLFGDEAIPISLVQNLKTSGTLADLFYVTNVLVHTGDVAKFFDVKVLLTVGENELVDIEKDSVNVNSMVKPTVSITALGRFINPLLKVNITTHNGDDEPYAEMLNMDYHVGVFRSNRISSINKLGPIGYDVIAWFASELSAPLIITKSIRSRVSLPMEITCDARLTADEAIPVGGVIEPGTNFRVQVDGKYDDSIEIQDTTSVTLSVTDAAGALLYHKNEEFKGQQEFVYQLPGVALPSGIVSVVVEVGDKVNGVHTRKAFDYKINNEMAATDIEVPGDLKLSDVLRVKVTPALYANGEYIPFTNEKFIEGEVTDAAGEAFYPQTAAETQRYSMRIKVGGVVVKTVEGEVIVGENNKLTVEFESAVDENLDFATGFSVEFQFDAENSAPILLKMEREAFVKVDSKIIAEGSELKTGAVSYGDKLRAEFKLKDEDSNKYLTAGRAFPVLVVLSKNERQVLLEKKCKINDDEFSANIPMSAAIPAGPVIVAVMVRKGADLVPVQTANGPYETEVTITGKIEFLAKVRETGRFVVVDFTTLINNNKLRGTAFSCRIVEPATGVVVADIPLAQKKKGSRLSWEAGAHKGSFNLELRRLNDPEGKPLFIKQITVEKSIQSLIYSLPIEGLAVIFSFCIFVWSIKLRKGIRATR